MGQCDIQWPVAQEWNREGNEGRVKAGLLRPVGSTPPPVLTGPTISHIHGSMKCGGCSPPHLMGLSYRTRSPRVTHRPVGTQPLVLLVESALRALSRAVPRAEGL